MNICCWLITCNLSKKSDVTKSILNDLNDFLYFTDFPFYFIQVLMNLYEKILYQFWSPANSVYISLNWLFVFFIAFRSLIIIIHENDLCLIMNAPVITPSLYVFYTHLTFVLSTKWNYITAKVSIDFFLNNSTMFYLWILALYRFFFQRLQKLYCNIAGISF